MLLLVAFGGSCIVAVLFPTVAIVGCVRCIVDCGCVVPGCSYVGAFVASNSVAALFLTVALLVAFVASCSVAALFPVVAVGGRIC